MGIESCWNKIREELPAPVLEHYEKFSRTLRVMGIPVTKNFAPNAMPADLQPPLKGKSCRFGKIGFPL